MFVEVKDPEDKVSRPLSPAEPSALPFPARPGRCWFFPLLLAAAAPLPSIAGCWGENPDLRSRPQLGRCGAGSRLLSASSRLLPDSAEPLPRPEPPRFSRPVRWKLTCLVGVAGGLIVVLAVREFRSL